MVPPQSPTTSILTQLSKDDVHFEVRQYEPQDRDQVLKLVADNLLQYEPEGHPRHEFWVQYVSDGLSDVEDVPGHYLNAGSNFFVVTAATVATAATGSDGEEKAATPVVVATTAVERKSDSVAEVRRVSVKAKFRRFGVGRMLMHHVHEWARHHEQKYEKLIVFTAVENPPAIKFYQSLGYKYLNNAYWTKNPSIEMSHFEKCL